MLIDLKLDPVFFYVIPKTVQKRDGGILICILNRTVSYSATCRYIYSILCLIRVLKLFCSVLETPIVLLHIYFKRKKKRLKKKKKKLRKTGSD